MDIFLGEPPANIKQWIIEHATPPGPTGHPETRFTLQNGDIETHNITGTLDRQQMIDNGYYDGENYEWLKTITQADIGNTVTSIGNQVFQNCSELTSVTIPNSVTSIGDLAFAYCEILNNVTIPDNVTSIGLGAFLGCTDLTRVTMPDSVTSIGAGAFEECRGLTSVTIPDSVTSIGDRAFLNCYGLTTVTIVANGGNANNVKQMIITTINDTSISDNITWNMPQPATHADTWYKYANDTAWRTVSISGAIEGSYDEEDDRYIPTSQIPDVENVVALEIGTYVTSIGECAFEGCSVLTSITVPNSVTYILDCPFPYQNANLSLTFIGRTMDQIETIPDFANWGLPEGFTIHCLDGDYVVSYE